jgi:SOS-response transcriptional repressor LexA
MKTLAEILRTRIEELGYSDIKDFARAHDVPYELLRKVISAGHLPKDKTLQFYADKFGLDLELLIKTVYQQKAPMPLKHIFRAGPPRRPTPVGDFREVPVLGKAACGPWLESHQFEEGLTESVEIHDPEAFFVIAEGESMIGGNILPGSYLLVSPSAPVSNGQIVLAKRGESDLTIKTYHRKADGTVVLNPMNPDFAPLVLQPGEPLSVMRVTEVRMKL